MSIKSPPQNEDTFHKARSRLIDAFARVESSVVVALKSADKPVKKDSLAAKIKTLRALQNQNGAWDAALERLADLNLLRADLVHGSMMVIDYDGERLACFRNALGVSNPVQAASLVSYKHLKELAGELDKLSDLIAPS